MMLILRTVLQLSKMMRYVLYEGNKKIVPMESEYVFLENYVKLMSLRYNPEKIEIINDTISYLTELEDAVNTYIEELKKVHGFYLIQTETVNTIKIKSGSDYKKYKRKQKQE